MKLFGVDHRKGISIGMERKSFYRHNLNSDYIRDIDFDIYKVLICVDIIYQV